MAEVKCREDANGGEFFVEEAGLKIAELTFIRENPHLVVMDHTFVDSSLRGQGIARQLLDAGIAWARKTGTKIVPVCPYVMAQFDKDPAIRDVRSL